LSDREFAKLNDRGLALWRAGKRKEAFHVFLDSAQRFPGNATARANLGFMLLRGGALAEARAEYEAALRLDPNHADAKRGLAAVLAQMGAAQTERLRELAGTGNAVSHIPYRGTARGVRVLLPVSLGSGNLQYEPFLDARVFAVTKLVVELFDPARPLPECDVVLCAIGDAESGAEALATAQRLLRGIPEDAILNRPERVAATTRAANAERLRAVPGAATARTRAYPRERLLGGDAAARLQADGFAFPLLLRSPGHHTGEHFLLVERPEGLAAAVRSLPGEDLYAIEYLDVRDADGKVRKYRVMFVDGKLYPLHLAVSSNWKVHYFSAEMADVPEHRAEEERFLSDMRSVLGERVEVLERISRTLALDYAGIDFALGPRGQVVVFEANATMVIVRPAHEERWAYRQAPVGRVIDAVREMLLARAQRQLAQRP
jgi:hypothetical protein